MVCDCMNLEFRVQELRSGRIRCPEPYCLCQRNYFVDRILEGPDMLGKNPIGSPLSECR